MINYPSIRPEIFSYGWFAIRWYGVMYVIGYSVAYFVLRGQARRGIFKASYNAIESLISYNIVGMLLGARLAYTMIYNWDYYSMYPSHILKIWEGGLSFHGAAVGMIVACAMWGRSRGIPFYSVTDMLAFSSSSALFFGRMGNFINAELYGRPSDVPWAMIFPTDPLKIPRHPSQLYQALTEGILLFTILSLLQRSLIARGKYRYGLIGGSFLVGYGGLRFLTEFAREPDVQLGFVLGPLSMGQVLCAIMMASGIGVLIHATKASPLVVPTPPDAVFLNA